jgi:hypothetical protein
VKSVTTEKFRLLFAGAAAERQIRIRSAYRLWKENPAHRSLRFKKVHPRLPIYSARVDLDWRAVGVLEDDTLVWFWVGPHPQYEALLKSL